MLIALDAMPIALDAAAATPWHLPGWACRCELRIERRADSTAAWVELYHAGRIRPDAADIRVLDENGALLPHVINTIGPGDRVLITFKIPETDTAWLYFGYGGASSPQYQWQPRAGLLLNVYRLGEGRSDNVEQFNNLVRTSTELLGSGYRPKVFDGFSPFSDSDQFLAVYDGWLRIDNPATYSFCTNSDDSSFLYINGTLVASFPGRHGPHAVRGEQNGAVKLDKGIHRFTYFHVEYSGGQAAVAGWKPPGAKYYSLLEDHMFVPISPAETKSVESQSGPLLDFTFEHTANYACDEFGTKVMVGMVFKPAHLGELGARSVRWSFGDGQTSTERTPNHAYLSHGLKTVMLDVVDKSNRTWRVAHQLPVYVIEGFNAQRPALIAQRAAEIVSRYDLDALQPNELAVLAEFWHMRGSKPDLVRVLRTLLNRLPDGDAGFGEYGVMYLEVLADAVEPGLVAQRERAFDALLGKDLDARYAMRVHLLYGDHLLMTARDFAKAEEHYRTAVELAKSGDVYRTALIRLGDVALEQGNVSLARERYEAVPLNSRQARTETVLHNAYGHLVENSIRQDLYDDALATIEEWETALPADKLDGYSFALRVRIALARRDSRTAKRYATLIVDKLEADEHKPEAYYALITLLVAERSTAQARALYDRFKEAFPTNYLVEKLSATMEAQSPAADGGTGTAWQNN